jgi:S-DNA-T family DNA segregation ATPase FtsK/SpoIIIE
MAKAAKSKKKEREIEQQEIDFELVEKRKNEIIGILIIAFGIFSFISLFTPTAGLVGEKLAEYYYIAFGVGSFVIPVILLYWGSTLIYKKGFIINTRVIGFLIVFISFISLYHTYLFSQYPLDYALLGYGGGVIGGSIAWLFMKLFGRIGTYILLGTFTLIGLLLWADVLLSTIFQKLKEVLKKLTKIYEKKTVEEDVIDFTSRTGEEYNYLEVEEDYQLEDYPQEEIAAVEPEEIELPKKQNPKEDKADKDEGEVKKLDNNEIENYLLPGINLLKDTDINRKKPGNKSQVLEETLQSFGVNARVIKVNHGPTITRYEVQPASGVKVSRIVSLADDIALALAAPGVRIEAPIPGKAAVGVEVPHQQNITVCLRDIISSREFVKSKGKLILALGMGIDGKPIVADLTQMPHLLVAGATGSGKSVCINTIITSILYKATPEEVKFILIDPKKVELIAYKGLPHLFAPVVTDPKKASSVLKLVVEEMENRYELFSESGTRGITSYNKSVGPEERLPYIVVVIDELSDLMMVAASEVEDNICRLAQMARAAGIHLVIATQRPSVDVITGLIKANIPSRISFAVSSQTDSRTILDMGGAEKLLGKGDMLFAPAGTQKPQRVQGAFIDNDEINRIVNFVKNQGNPDYEFDLEDIKEVSIEIDDERDELYEEAVKLVVKYRASISMLQRRLHVGHSRAARLIDMMEEDGIVGPYAGSKPREVLITEEELDDFLANR